MTYTKTRIIWIPFIIALFFCAAVCGCGTTGDRNSAGTDSGICGTWKEELFDSGYEFREDGTGTDTFWDLPFTYTTTEDGILLLTYDDPMWGKTEYNYSVSGDLLSLQQKGSEETFEYIRQ